MSALFDEYKKIDQSDHAKAITFLIEKCNAFDYDDVKRTLHWNFCASMLQMILCSRGKAT